MRHGNDIGTTVTCTPKASSKSSKRCSTKSILKTIPIGSRRQDGSHRLRPMPKVVQELCTSDTKPPIPALCSYGDGMRQLRQCLQKRRGLEKCAPFTDCSRFFANLSHARIMSALFCRGPIERAHPARRGNAKSVHSIVERGFSICDLDRECHEGSYKRWLPTR